MLSVRKKLLRQERVTNMLTDLMVRLDNVSQRNEDPRFYFVWHNRLFNILLTLLLLNVFVWSVGAYFAFNRSEAKTYAQTADGTTRILTTVDSPEYNNVAIEEWSENVIKIAYNYDFSHYNEQLIQAKPYFSPEAWTIFVDTFKKNVLPQILEKKLQVSVAVDKAKLVGPPETIAGVTTWRAKIPALISYVSASESTTKKVEFDLLIKRQVSYTNPKGLWVTKLNENSQN